MNGLSIRWKLTLWYGAVFSAILVGFSSALYLLMRHHLVSLADTVLHEEYREFRDEVGRARTVRELCEALESRFAALEGHQFELSDTNGAVLFRSAGVRAAGLPRIWGDQVGDAVVEELTVAGMGRVHLARGIINGPSGPLLAEVATGVAAIERASRELVMVLITIVPAAVGCALWGGWWLARKALAPVDLMAATAAEITSTRLDKRLDERGAGDELGRLARSFNGMIERLERSFDEVRRFTADAAHELRTPLANMRTEVEVALRSRRCAERDGLVLENLIEEMERLGRLVSQLLFLCREDSGVGMPDQVAVRLDEVMSDVADHMEAVAREKGIVLLCELDRAWVVRGDKDRIRQVCFNLLDNAIKYTPAGGRVTVTADPADDHARVTITDTGIGIAAPDLPRVFDRFSRVDPARSSETEGSGLGLAICRSIVEAHGGKIEIESTLGESTTVIVSLPLLEASRPLVSLVPSGEVVASGMEHSRTTLWN